MVSVVSRHSNLEKISFVGHSLGGVVARYAIAVLYQQDLTRKESEENGKRGEEELSKSPSEERTRGKIAGLQPINFITSATPHLGARGHRQVLLITCASSFLSEWIHCTIRGQCVSTVLCNSWPRRFAGLLLITCTRYMHDLTLCIS